MFAISHHWRAFRRLYSTLTPREPMYFGIRVVGPHTMTSAPNFCKQKIFDKATLECNISPTITTFFPFTEPYFSLMENASSNAWVGCSWAPSPAFIILLSTYFDKKTQDPGLVCRMTIISTFIASMLFTVSISVSPFFNDEEDAEKLITSAERRFSANSNDNLVRVEFSKKRLAMVISLREGTFFIGRFIISLKLSAVLNIRLISSTVSPFMPSKCFTLRP